MNHDQRHTIWTRLRGAGCVLGLFLAGLGAGIGAGVVPGVATLTWDAPAGVTQFRVYLGAVREGWTNSVVVTTNRMTIKAGTVYGIASLGADGAESTLVYWPSNRIGEIRLREQSKTNVTTLERFTNAPVEAVRLWRVENVTVGWQ